MTSVYFGHSAGVAATHALITGTSRSDLSNSFVALATGLAV